MYEQHDTLPYKLRFLIVAILLIGNLFLVSLLLSTIGTSGTASPEDTTAPPASMRAASQYNDPNVVAGGLTEMANEISRTAGSASYVMADIFQSGTSATASAGKLTVQGGKLVGGLVQSGLTASVRSMANKIIFIIRIPINIFGFVSGTSVVRAAIQPADNTPVPIIGPYSPAMAASTAIAPAQPASQPHTHDQTAPAWPIHGQVTTLFGVPHWPWQPTHTGLDISSGQRSGVTPVKPFRPGQVIETVRSYSGLGNYVTIDHGGGLTSVYAHLYSIAVQTGQAVDKNSLLGTEGSTGASTGTHLHFEIRQNGQPVDPRHYVSGRP